MNILMTGCTGMLGSQLGPHLAERGNRLFCLTRGKGKLSAQDRLNAIFGAQIERCSAVEGDVREMLCGLSTQTIGRLAGKVEAILHTAASVKFEDSPTETGEIWCTNVEGTRNVLALAAVLGFPSFHYLSTAYVGGNLSILSENDCGLPESARNTYEHSKITAESHVREYPKANFSIYRTSILVGDSQTGFTPTFMGYYGFFAGFWRLRNAFQDKLLKSNVLEARYRKAGISFDRDGFLRLPIGISDSPSATLNLVPLDWVARTLSSLVALPARGETYHLVHPDPPPVRWVIDFSMDYLGIKDFFHGQLAAETGNPVLRSIQRGIDRELMLYLPYINHEPRFGIHLMKRRLGSAFENPPKVDEAFLGLMLDCATKTNFGIESSEPLVKERAA